MKLRLLVFTLCFSCFFSKAQDSEQNEVIPEDRKDKKEARIERQSGFETWMQTVFNHPDAGWFLDISAGYGIPFLPVRLESPREYIGNKDVFSNGAYTSEKALLGTNGGGGSIDFQFGRMHNSFIGWAVALTYSDYPVILDARINTPYYKAKQTTDSWTIGMSPMLVLNSGNMNNFFVYGKVGPFLPFLGNSISTVTIADNELKIITDVLLAGSPLADVLRGGIDLIFGNPDELPVNLSDLIELNIDAVAQTSFVPTIGINATVGFRYQFSDVVSLFAEGRVIAYTIKAKETSIYDFNFGGKILGQPLESLIPSIPLGDKEYILPFTEDSAPELLLTTQYINEVTSKSNNSSLNPQVDYSKPAEELAFRKNTSTIYANIGVQINIPKRDKETKKEKRKKNED